MADALPDVASPNCEFRWYVRIPLKWLVFLIVTWFILYPDPIRFARHVAHLRDLDAMIEPDAPELRAWDDELNARLTSVAFRLAARGASRAPDPDPSEVDWRASMSSRQVQRVVQNFVYDKVPYAWDWDVWGFADYMPTVAEMFARAERAPDKQVREDCDGRAVMAASLMRRMGYESRIVTDLRHVWVETPQGEWMGPGRAKAMRSTPEGNVVDWRAAFTDVPMALAFGVSVFPLVRELLIGATMVVLLRRRRMRWRWSALGAVVLGVGLLLLRRGGADLDGTTWHASAGLAFVAGALATMTIASHASRRASPRV